MSEYMKCKSYLYRHRYLFQNEMDSLLMKSGSKEKLRFEEYPAVIYSEPVLSFGPLFYKLLLETVLFFQMQHIDAP